VNYRAFDPPRVSGKSEIAAGINNGVFPFTPLLAAPNLGDPPGQMPRREWEFLGYPGIECVPEISRISPFPKGLNFKEDRPKKFPKRFLFEINPRDVRDPHVVKAQKLNKPHPVPGPREKEPP